MGCLRLTGLALALACAGCSTPMVTSQQTGGPPPSGTLIAYAAAKSIIQIDITETTPKASPAPPEPANANANANAGPPTPGCEQAVSRFPAVQAGIRGIGKAFEALRPTVTDALDQAERQASRLPTKDPDPSRPVVAPAPLLDSASRAAAAEALGEVGAGVERLRRLSTEATMLTMVIVETCPPREAQITLTHRVVPDPDHVYYLRARRDLMADDTFDFHVGENGLLSAVSTTAVDRTGDVAASAAAVIGRFSAMSGLDLGPGAGGGSLGEYPMLGGSGPNGRPDPLEPADTSAACADISTASFSALARGLAGKPDCVTLRRLIFAVGHWPPSPEIPVNPRPPFPKTTWLTLAELKAGMNVPYLVQISANCGGEPANEASSRADAAGPADYPGVVTAMLRPCEVKAVVSDRKIAYFSFVAVDSDHPLILPLDRTRFVKREMGYEFANGTATHAKDARPSPAIAVVALPSQVIGGLLSGITDTFKGQTSIEQQEQQYYSAEAARMQARAALQRAQQADAAPK